MNCKVHVIEAADVPNQDESNFYVRLNMSSSDSPNETDVATNNPPHWDSPEFTFQFKTKEDTELEIVLLSGDKVGNGKEIGSSNLSLSEFENGTDTDKWIELKSDDGSNAGRLHLVIRVSEEIRNVDDILKIFSDDDDVSLPDFDKSGLENKEFQSKLANNSSDDVDLILKVSTVSFTVINLKNADQIPQISSNVESAELYCTLSTSESDKIVKTKAIKDPITSSWNQSFRFHVDDKTSAKYVVNLYNANEDTENEELATGTFTINDIDDKKDITIDLHSTQNPSVSAQLDISVEFLSADFLSEEESNPLDNLDNLSDDSQKEEQQNEVELLPEQLNESPLENHDQIENHEENEQLVQDEHQNEQKDQNDVFAEVDQKEEEEQKKKAESLEENDQRPAILDDKNENELQNEYQEPNSDQEEENQKETNCDHQKEEEQIEMLNGQEGEEGKIETHIDHQEEEQIEMFNDQEGEEGKIETHSDHQEEEQIEMFNDQEEEGKIETHSDHQEEEQIETNIDLQEDEEQIETNEDEVEVELPNNQQEQVIEEEEEEAEEGNNQDIYDDYEEDQNYASKQTSSRPPTKEQKFGRTIKNLLISVRCLNSEEAEDEKEQVFNYVKEEANELYQDKVISVVERNEENSRKIVFKLTKNSEELEELHKRMNDPNNMSFLKLQREIKKLKKEINGLDTEINSISDENDELENYIFMMQQKINGTIDE